ncbi:MAG: OsmC family peroxiredoxin [Acidobacteria bacterium]|nr:OsmC family peroxiredoxin [Acidobacteriota bacterium]
MAKVYARSLEKYQVLLNTEDHAILADEPEEIGDGLGPDPYELLLSALGACTTMTVQMYARKKGWDLQSMRAELVHERIHASDCNECEETEGYIERIRVKLAFEGELDDEQRARLKEIAGKCPVRRTLLGTPRIMDV